VVEHAHRFEYMAQQIVCETCQRVLTTRPAVPCLSTIPSSTSTAVAMLRRLILPVVQPMSSNMRNLRI
jgi:hypothetical protein